MRTIKKMFLITAMCFSAILSQSAQASHWCEYGHVNGQPYQACYYDD